MIQGRVIQTSTWVIGGKAAGINFREGMNGTTFTDKSPFLPHYVKPIKGLSPNIDIKVSRIQYDLNRNIYRDLQEDIYQGRIKFRILPNYLGGKDNMLYDTAK